MKYRRIPTWVLAVCLTIAVAAGAFAANGSFQFAVVAPDTIVHRSIAPISIPVRSGGTSNIGMTRLGFRTGANGDSTSISQITVQAQSDGTFNDAWVTGIRVYFEHENVTQNHVYDHGYAGDDVRADINEPVGGYKFVSGTVDIDLDPAVVLFDRPGGDPNYLYVVVDLSENADISTNFACAVTNVVYGLPNDGTGSSAAPPALGGANGTRQNLDKHQVRAQAAGIAAASPSNDTDVEIFRLDLDLSTTDTSATAYLSSVKVHRVGGADNWVAGNGVLLYADDGDDVFEPGAGDGAAVATVTLGATQAGYAILTVNPTVEVPSTGKSFFVALNLDSANAVPQDSFGMELQNPATDVTFADEIEDDNSLVPTEYAYVYYTAAGTYEYNQVAFVDPASTTTIPGSGNTFTVEPPDDEMPPTVATKFPAAGALSVDRDTDITVVFNEYMNETGALAGQVTNTANYVLFETLTPLNTVSLGLSYVTDTQTLTVDPATVLVWGTQYTFTVYHTVQDYYGTPMGTDAGSDYSWNFTVEPAVNPTVLAVYPEEDAEDVVVERTTTTIRVTFSEPLKGASVGPGDLVLEDHLGANVSGTVGYDPDTQTVILSLDADLTNSETYTATVPAGAVTDMDDLPLLTEKSWSFTTINLYPPFTEPVIIKNRIVTGGNQQALIFVTEPPRGPADRVTVQVFTNTGKRVATLVNRQAFTTISSPILWDGTNGKGQPLGPGLYYVQIRATDYKRVLKVLIVR